ncbi:MAG: hypothetical protein ABR533_09160, partial [Desulfonatronovibrio sp.]
MKKEFQEKGSKVLSFSMFIIREFLSPAIYITGIIVGTAVVFLMGTFSLIPYIVPILVQAVSRGSINYARRLEGQLAKVPAMRPDPTFVMNHSGEITLSAGVTEKLFEKYAVSNISHFIDEAGTGQAMSAVRTCREQDYVFVAYSPVVDKHYELTVIPAQTGCDADSNQFIVWFKDITPRIHLLNRQKTMLSYFNELLENIRKITRQKNLDELLAGHILESYSAVFIARIDESGE